MSLKPWREVAIPHEDVLHGKFQQAEFAADISRVHEGTATAEYQDPALFFQRTFITEGMRLLLESVVKRLCGKGGDPVIQLQTAFGGGKTHTMLAVYHLARGEKPASVLAGIPPILDAAHVTELPRARIAVLDGINLSPNQPQKRGNVTVQTLWGELAWQLGGEAAYAQVADADRSGTSPGKEVLTRVLAEHAPCVILIDELVAYIRQFEDGKALTGGTYDSNLTFVQALTESLKAVPTAVMLASLPESDKEAGSQKGVQALATLSHYFGRVQALWKPVATEEAFEIVRRRLFTDISDRKVADQVCRAYADMYAANKGEFPAETLESHYLDRLQHAYPIHPEVFDRLYEDWSSLDSFQRTRGVLKLMARVIHRLWKDGNNDLMIQPASLPLYDNDVRNDSIYYLSQGWDPVVERDIDGERAAATELDSNRPLLGSIQACRRLTRTIFLGSAPDAGGVGSAKNHRGIETEGVMLGCMQPGQVSGHYRDGLRALVDRLQYLNSANGRFWFDTRPNLRREMEDRKRRFEDKDHVNPVIRDKLRIANGVFGAVHVFAPSGDVPDDFMLRLVVLPPDAAFSRNGQGLAIERATAILKQRGDQPRQRQNRLIFLAADMDNISRLREQVRSMLAWQSIVSDVSEGRLNIDMHQTRQASAALDEARQALERMVRESYKWLLAPMQDATRGKGISELQWEHFALNPATVNRSQEIEQVLRENELLITDWAPVHLANLLRTWFWNGEASAVKATELWQKTCSYLYLPRLRDSDVLRQTLAAGAVSRDFFGLAYGVEGGGRYTGFHFGQATTPVLDDSLLLIETGAAAAFDAVLQDEAAARAQPAMSYPPAASGTVQHTGTGGRTPVAGEPSTGRTSSDPTGGAAKRSFYATVELDPVKAKVLFSDVTDEVLMLLAKSPDVRLKVTVEIDAQTTAEAGFDESLQRAVRENCNQLKFKSASFESE